MSSARSAKRRSPWPTGGSLDGAKVVGSDLEADLAVLELPTPVAFPDAVAGDPAAPTRDERVFLVGYPKADVEQPTSTITEGAVAADPLEWRDELTYLGIDASIDDGQSGGVLADGEGRVLGITNGSRDGHPVALAIDDAVMRAAAILDGRDLDGIADRLPQPGPADAPTDVSATIRNRRTRRPGSSRVARMMVQGQDHMAGDATGAPVRDGRRWPALEQRGTGRRATDRRHRLRRPARISSRSRRRAPDPWWWTSTRRWA